MSHELRTPLNAITGFSELMEHRTYGSLGHPKYEEYATDIKESGRHLLSLINDILDLSKIEAGKLELNRLELDFADVAAACLRIVDERARKAGVSIATNFTNGGTGTLFADERAIKQILINLLSNAIKFTEAGGTIDIAAGPDDRRGYVVSVVDTGIGIAPDDLPKVIEPFGQVHNVLTRKNSCTGLGLPLSKALAEMHGASFELESAPGVGTTVTMRFPPESGADLAQASA
jgi:signal transduction histidine kinase